MKATLHKMLSGYLLSLNGDIDDPYAIVNEQLADDYGWYKLSLKNCESIERGYDLDELAKTIFPDKIFTTDEEHEIPVDGPPYQWGFKVGFQKALELMNDKKFSEEDMEKAYSLGWGNSYKLSESLPLTNLHQFIESLQQTEWDVEIEMEQITLPFGANQFINESKPKLDENGCLILKKI